MRKQSNKKFDKLRKKHIWPSVVLLVGVMFISFISFLLALSFYTVNIIDNKMTKGHEEANEIKFAIDKELAAGATYEEAITSFAKANPTVSFCVLDSDNQMVASAGDVTIDLSDREKSIAVEMYFEDEQDDTYEFLWDVEDKNQTLGIMVNGNHSLSIIHDVFRGKALDEGKTSWYRATLMRVPIWITSAPFVDGNVIAVKQMLSLQRNELFVILLIGACFLVIVLIVLLVLLGNVISNVHYQRRLTKLVSTDSVTGGNNWFYFSEHADRILAKRRNATTGYAIVDFEWMKYRNFSGLHGIAEGEQKLTQILNYIQSKLQKKELCARNEKANFAILLRGGEMEYATEIETRVQSWIDELPAVLGYSNLIFHAGIYDVDAQFDEAGTAVRRKNIDSKTLFGNASVARAAIDTDNESGIKHFNQKMWDDQMWEHKIEDGMQAALDREEYLVYIQPKYNPVTEELAGAEALIRWQHPTEGFLPPGRFIPIFEKSNFITKIDDYMISHVARMQAEWIARGKKVVPVSVNVSRIHFAQPDLAEHIARLVDVYNVPHKYIEIELTESAFFDDRDALLGTIKKLQELGFEVSMDDFGAGYSSLNSLKDLPLDVLKLDADFFRGDAEGDRREVVVSQAIDLAKHLNMRIVAEGIEEKEQVDFLAKCGCDMIQGYYFSKPLPAYEYEERMSNKE